MASDVRQCGECARYRPDRPSGQGSKYGHCDAWIGSLYAGSAPKCAGHGRDSYTPGGAYGVKDRD